MTRRKDGLWQEVATINGRKKYFYGKSKAEVLKKLREFQEVQERGPLFEEVAEAWREEHWKQIVPSTARGYEASFKRAMEAFSQRPIKEISAQEIAQLIQRLAQMQYGKKVVVTQKNLLNMIFNHAMVQGIISANPCTPVAVPPRLRTRRRELPTVKDLEAVMQSDWLLPVFLYFTGCRRGEALAVTYEDIDWEGGFIRIDKAVGYDGNRPYIKTTKTEAGRRNIPLLDKLAERIPREGKGLIFPNQNGELYLDSQIRRDWERWQKQNGVTVTPHQLRHGYATILYDAGLDVKDAQYSMGHTTIAMTQDIYTHIHNQRQREISAKLNKYVNKMQ